MVDFRSIFCNHLDADVILADAAGDIGYVLKRSHLLGYFQDLVRIHLQPDICLDIKPKGLRADNRADLNDAFVNHAIDAVAHRPLGDIL